MSAESPKYTNKIRQCPWHIPTKAKVVTAEYVKKWRLRTCDGSFGHSMRIQELQEASGVNKHAE